MNCILLEINGIQYAGWTEVKVTKSIENFCGSFSFKTTALENNSFPIKRGSACKVVINGINVINGWVEKIEVSYDAGSHNITISGRDRTCDIVDSKLPAISDFPNGVTLKSIVEQILKLLNLSDIKVIDPYGLTPFANPVSQDVAISAFDFIETYAKKRQVLLTTNGDGNIVFQRAATTKYKTVLSADKNNIGSVKKATISYDDTNRFNTYTMKTQDNLSNPAIFGVKKSIAPKKNVDISGDAHDIDIRKSRILTVKPDDDGTAGENSNNATWEATFRKSQSIIYTCDVQGFMPANDKEIWSPNKQVQVQDAFADIPSSEVGGWLLISDITYSQSLSEGSVTSLKLVTRNSFTMQINKTQKEKTDYKESEFGTFPK